MKRLLGTPWVALLVCVSATSLAADDGKVAITVGSATMTTGAIERRLGSMPSYQLARYGTTPDAVRKGFVEQVLVPEMLFGEEALRRKLDQSPAMATRVRDLLKEALDRSLKEEALQKEPVTKEELQKYYDDNKTRFETPKRIRIWRVQVADEATAKKLIQDSRGADGVQKWREFAREKSLDKATAQRNGDLGFVRPDGSTDVPRVQVDPRVFNTADKVADGALVAEPMKEGDRWSVIWRRGSIAAMKRTLEDEEKSIRSLLERRRIDKARKDLIARLQKEHVKESHPDLLSHIDMRAYGEPPSARSPARDAGPRRLTRDGGLRAPVPMGSAHR
jgi:peptidyl-prolyl cis-trans isomerase C